PLLLRTRRHFFKDCAVGLGSMALASLLNEKASAAPQFHNPLAPQQAHFPAKAKAVIYLFMAGAPSQLELFDYKPKLVAYNGRPSMGAWVTYGLGSESQSLPGFVVLQSGPRGPRGGAPLWGSGFLPTSFQGVPFRSGGDPILNLSSPKGVTPQRQKDVLDAV